MLFELIMLHTASARAKAAKARGYRTERKIRLIFEKHGWKVIRAGASLGEADLICIKKGKCILLQVKSTKRKMFYYYGYRRRQLEGFSFFLVIDFGYGRIRIINPKAKVRIDEGLSLDEFLRNPRNLRKFKT